MTDKETASAEVGTRKPDDDVGTPGSPATGGGRQTAEQAAITGLGVEGRSDAERQQDRHGSDHGAGKNSAPIGGSSSGQSDRKNAEDGGTAVPGRGKAEEAQR